MSNETNVRKTGFAVPVLGIVLLLVLAMMAWPAGVMPAQAQAGGVFAEGAFAGGYSYDGVWVPGAEWRLYKDGRLVVGSGYIVTTVFPLAGPWDAHRTHIISIEFTGPMTAGASLANLFRSLTEVMYIYGLLYFDTRNVTNMSEMFSHTSSLTSLDLSGWDTSNVIWMSGMFYSASSLTNLDVSGWDTSSVVHMSGLFSNTRSLANLDVSGWDTSSVTQMGNMFSGTNSLTNLDLSGWDTRNAPWISGIFSGTTGLYRLVFGEYFFVVNANLFPNSVADDTFTGFWTNEDGTRRLNFAQVMPVGGFALAGTWTRERWPDGVRAVGVFADGQSYEGEPVPGAFWHLYEDGRLVVGSGFIVTPAFTFFSPWGAHSLYITSITFTGPMTAGASMEGLFNLLPNLTDINGLAYFDTRNLTDMSNMFYNTSALTNLDLSGWDTRNVTNMSQMFSNANSMTSLDLSGWDTRNVTVMNHMFFGANSLTSLDLSGWDTSNVKNMWSMFGGTTALRRLVLGENFFVLDNINLPVLSNDLYRGWINEITGEQRTSAQLFQEGHRTPAGVWTWERRETIPSPITIAMEADGVTVRWATVPEAAGFAIYINDVRSETWGRTTTSINLLILHPPLAEGDRIQVRALVPDYFVELSNTIVFVVVPAPPPPVINIDGTLVYWTPIPNSSGFSVYINGVRRLVRTFPESTPFTNFNLATLNLFLEDGDVVQIRALGNFRAELSNAVTFVVVPAPPPPTVAVDGMRLYWTPVADATQFAIYANGVQRTTTTNVTEFNLMLFEISWFVPIVNGDRLQVRALGNFRADLSEPVTFVTASAPPPPVITIDGAVVHWTAMPAEAMGVAVYVNGVRRLTSEFHPFSTMTGMGLAGLNPFPADGAVVQVRALGNFHAELSNAVTFAVVPAPPPPTVAVDGMRLYWTPVAGVTHFAIYANGTRRTTTFASDHFDLTFFETVWSVPLAYGDFVQVRALGNFRAELSNAVFIGRNLAHVYDNVRRIEEGLGISLDAAASDYIIKGIPTRSEASAIEALSGVASVYAQGPYIGTGTVIVFDDGTELTVVVYGDVTGTGTVEMDDVATVLDHIRGREVLDGPQYAAADIRGTGIDLRALNRLLTYYRGRLPSLRG